MCVWSQTLWSIVLSPCFIYNLQTFPPADSYAHRCLWNSCSSDEFGWKQGNIMHRSECEFLLSLGGSCRQAHTDAAAPSPWGCCRARAAPPWRRECPQWVPCALHHLGRHKDWLEQVGEGHNINATIRSVLIEQLSQKNSFFINITVQSH